jgi:ubiquitin C-terminal hydrolase
MDKIDMDKMVAALDKMTLDKTDLSKTRVTNKSNNASNNNSNNQKKYSFLVLVEWNHLRKSLWSKNNIVRPISFVKTIQFVAKKNGLQEFTSFRQTDIQEFMLFFVDCLHTSLSRKIKIDISGQPVTKTDTLATKCFEMIKQRYEHDYSEFWNLFYGIQVSEICDAKTNEIFSQTPEPYFIIDLPVTITTSSNTLLSEISSIIKVYSCKISLFSNNSLSLK